MDGPAAFWEAPFDVDIMKMGGYQWICSCKRFCMRKSKIEIQGVLTGAKAEEEQAKNQQKSRTPAHFWRPLASVARRDAFLFYSLSEFTSLKGRRKSRTATLKGLHFKFIGYLL